MVGQGAVDQLPYGKGGQIDGEGELTCAVVMLRLVAIDGNAGWYMVSEKGPSATSAAISH